MPGLRWVLVPLGAAPMIALGFDTALSSTGCASAEVVDGGIRWSTQTVKGSAVSKHAGVLAEVLRLRSIVRDVIAFAPARFDICVVEGPAPTTTNSGKADERAALRWMICEQLIDRGPIVLVDPQTRAVLAWGRGMPRRTKGQTSAQAKAPLLEAVRLAVPEASIPGHDVADSVALARAGAHWLGAPVEYSDRQVSAHAAVAWPEKGGPVVSATTTKG